MRHLRRHRRHRLRHRHERQLLRKPQEVPKRTSQGLGATGSPLDKQVLELRTTRNRVTRPQGGQETIIGGHDPRAGSRPRRDEEGTVVAHRPRDDADLDRVRRLPDDVGLGHVRRPQGDVDHGLERRPQDGDRTRKKTNPMSRPGDGVKRQRRAGRTAAPTIGHRRRVGDHGSGTTRPTRTENMRSRHRTIRNVRGGRGHFHGNSLRVPP